MEGSERQVDFQTADGYTIYGSLHLPAGADPQRPVPAALLLHGPGHDRGALSLGFPGISQLLIRHGIAALRIDWRGRGQSIGELEYHSFTDEQRAKIPLDVRAALDFLASQPEVDRDRLAIFGEEIAAEWAALGARGDPRVVVFAFLSGRVSEGTRELLAAKHQLPVLCVVSREDEQGLADMSAVHAASTHPESDLRVYQDLGVGITMFTAWRYKYLDERAIRSYVKQGVDIEKLGFVVREPAEEKGPIEREICDWMAARLRSLGRVQEISFKTEDDVLIYGNLRIPENLADGERAPGIVLLHSLLSDRWVFHNFERVLAERGVAVLNIDFRGRGKSRAEGYAAFPPEVQERVPLDAKAALDVLADRPEVDSRRLAILGTYLGARYAVEAAVGDGRIRALVMLFGYIPTREERDQIAALPFPILFISSRGLGPVTRAMEDLCELTRDRGSEMILYDGGVLGYKLFDFDEALEPRIAGWVGEHLTDRG